MKNLAITFLSILFCATLALAQDVIIKKNGEEIKSKVKGVSTTEIEYNKFDNIDGPVYKLNKSEVLLIIYANGTKDIFSTESTSNSTNSTSNSATSKPTEIANRPTQKFYNYDFFDRKVPVTFLGVDFSKCKLVGTTLSNPQSIFGEINKLFVTEDNKYNIKGAVRRFVMPNQFSLIEKLNNDVDVNSLTENVTANITYSDLQGIVDNYNLSEAGLSDGLALVIICDNLNSPRRDAAFFYVVFDVISKKILFSDRLIGKAGGNGERNYWARALYETITTVQDTKFGQWKMMYRK